VALLALAPVISAQPASAADRNLGNEFIQEVVDAAPTTLIPATGQSIEPALLNTVDQVVDAAGKVLRTGRSDLVASASSGGLDEFPCVKNGGSSRLRIFPVSERRLQGTAGAVQFLYHPYLLFKARKVKGLATNQFEICTVGGGALRDGNRLYQVGTGMALADPSQTHKIGQRWESGSTPKDYSLSMGFQVAPKDSPISISASVSQTPTDKLMGSIIGPYQTVVDHYPANAVNAWWQDECVDSWKGCHFSWNGSANFQGTIAQGLWEYPADSMPSTVRFYFMPYVERSCNHWYSSC
jgi:hypothetical protein